MTLAETGHPSLFRRYPTHDETVHAKARQAWDRPRLETFSY